MAKQPKQHIRRSEARDTFEREIGKAPGEKPKPQRLKKGSPEAKARMAELRSMRGKKGK